MRQFWLPYNANVNTISVKYENDFSKWECVVSPMKKSYILEDTNSKVGTGMDKFETRCKF